ncbi:MAG: hypothetical protein AAF399_11810, partial [Bacteroidota bacterium]
MKTHVRYRLWFGCLLLIWNAQAFSQPLNDDLCNVIQLTVDVSCGGIPNGDITDATSEPNEPGNSCIAIPPINSVWFGFVAPASGLVDISADIPVVGGTLQAAEMTLFQLVGPCTDLSFLQEVACDRNGGTVVGNGDMPLMRRVPVTPGQTYYLSISSLFGQEGSFCLEVASATLPPPPVNDDLCQAILLQVDASCNGLPIATITGATEQPLEQEPLCAQAPFSEQTVWFQFIAPSTGLAHISMNYPIGTLEDALIGVYELQGDCTNPINLSAYTCQRDENQFREPLPGFIGEFVPGQTYYIQVKSEPIFGNYNEPEGEFCLTVESIDGSVPPVNDDPCNALPLQIGGNPMVFNNIGATVLPNESSLLSPPTGTAPFGFWEPGKEGIEHSVWFSLVAPSSGAIQVDATDFSPNPSLDIQVALYEASDCNDLTTFNLLDASDDLSGELTFLLPSCLTPGQTYYLLVDGGPFKALGRFSLLLFENTFEPLAVTTLPKDPYCPGSATGSVLSFIEGGNFLRPYDFTWSNGDTLASQLGNLSAGTYTLTVTDDCDSTVVQTIIITDPPEPVVDAGPTVELCFGDSATLGIPDPISNGRMNEMERFVSSGRKNFPSLEGGLL